LKLEKDAAGNYAGTLTGARGDMALRDVKVGGDTLTAEAVVEAAQASVRTKLKLSLQGQELRGSSETDFGGQTFNSALELRRAGAAPVAASGSPAPGQAPASPSPAAPATGGRRQSPPQPTQKQSLEYFEGRWNFRWVGRESALTPGGVVEGTMLFKAMPESAFLEGQVEGRAKGGSLGEKLLLGFGETNKSLVLLEQRNGIQTLSFGDWTSPIAVRFRVAPFQAGGRRLRLNRTLTIVAVHSFTLTEELSEDGGPFVRLGNAVFSRPAEAAAAQPAKN
jgi:hypothetical protein